MIIAELGGKRKDEGQEEGGSTGKERERGKREDKEEQGAD